MVDVFSKNKRSEIMSLIKSKNTKPEKTVRSHLHKQGYRFVLHDKRLPGKPDIVLPRYKTVVEVNGCFWHGHEGCKKASIPKTRTEFWLNKIQSNKARDARHRRELKESGWRVIEVWQCEIGEDRLNDLFRQITRQ